MAPDFEKPPEMLELESVVGDTAKTCDTAYRFCAYDNFLGWSLKSMQLTHVGLFRALGLSPESRKSV